jgi:hypothetical protein
MKRFGLSWHNEAERSLPQFIEADGYRFVDVMPDYSKNNDHDNRVVEFYKGDETVATMINWPMVIRVEADLSPVS